MNYLDNLTARTSTPAEIAQNTNNVKVPAPNINLDYPNDSLTLYEMSEDMQLTKYNYGGAHIYDGTLNGKQTNIRSVFTNPKTCEYEYTIGDKKLIMTNHNFEKYTGTYNGKEFELYTTRNKSKDYTKDYIQKIKGTIGDEEINITLKGAPIPKDNDTRDIITSVLFANFNAPFVIDGKIAQVVMAHSADPRIEGKEIEKEKNIDKLLPIAYTVAGSLIAAIPSAIKGLVHLIKK